jgi:hypothetical protein
MWYNWVIMRNLSLRHRPPAQRRVERYVKECENLYVEKIGEPMTSLYNCKTTDQPGQYIITKFILEQGMEVESSYLVSTRDCACPRGTFRTCRHRNMLPYFRMKEHVDDGWFFEYNTRQWHEPVNDASPTNAPTEPEPTVLAEVAPEVAHPPAVVSVGAPRRRLIKT